MKGKAWSMDIEAYVEMEVHFDPAPPSEARSFDYHPDFGLSCGWFLEFFDEHGKIIVGGARNSGAKPPEGLGELANEKAAELLKVGDAKILAAFVAKAATEAGINWHPGTGGNAPHTYFSVESLNASYVVQVRNPRNIGRWIGKGGANIRRLSEILGRRVEIR